MSNWLEASNAMGCVIQVSALWSDSVRYSLAGVFRVAQQKDNPQVENEMSNEMSHHGDGFTPLNFHRMPRANSIQRSVEFLELMRKRRTVRQFSSDPVPHEIIENAIATAGTAPSGANQQPWRYVVVADPEIKRKIREAAEAEEKESYEHRMSD